MNPALIPMLIGVVILIGIIIWARKELEKLNNKKELQLM